MSSNDIRTELRLRASRGESASQLARYLHDRVGPDFKVFDFVRYFKDAFDVPLKRLNDAGGWIGFSPAGSMLDRDLDRLLAPWIRRSENKNQGQYEFPWVWWRLWRFDSRPEPHTVRR